MTRLSASLLSASLFAASLAVAGTTSAQTAGYYGSAGEGYDRSSDYSESEGVYDYARVLRVDPVIGSQYGSAQYGNNDGRDQSQCRYRQADDVYAGDDRNYDSYDRYGRNDSYRDDYYDDGYRGSGSGNQAGRTVATVIGGIAGAVLGSKVGDGSGRYVGTAVGSMVGGMAGRSIYDNSQRDRQYPRRGTVRVCDPVPAYSGYVQDDERLDGYDVTYEYANRTYRTRTNYHPGDQIRVRVDVRPE